ncbi:MAG TPA: hypothetical protein DIW64_16150 [Cellvibrio sp.]|nr:hypothetical protein [Cellvibrio sp.]
MKLNFVLSADEGRSVAIQGSRFYFEKGSYPIRVKMLSPSSMEFELEPGQGFVCLPDERFGSLEILNSDQAQSITIVSSDREIFDNRATISSTGSSLPVNVSAASIRVLPPKVTLVPDTATRILESVSTRKKAAVYFSADSFVGVDATVTAATGYPVFAGSDWIDENSDELWVISASAAVINIIEDHS